MDRGQEQEFWTTERTSALDAKLDPKLTAQQVAILGLLEAVRAEPFQRRFWSRVEKHDAGCWLWMGARTRRGYGQIRVMLRGRSCCLYTHRLAFLMHYGYLPSLTLEVCHNCNQPACVRADHLYAATHARNMHDAWTQGLMPPPPLHRGQGQHKAKLSASDVRDIRLRRMQGQTLVQIATIYAIDFSTVSDIARGKTWRHVLADTHAEGGRP